jgi:hypothetical protein
VKPGGAEIPTRRAHHRGIGIILGLTAANVPQTVSALHRTSSGGQAAGRLHHVAIGHPVGRVIENSSAAGPVCSWPA